MMPQMQMLPSYYEGPVQINNVTVTGNSFETNPPASGSSNHTTGIADILERGPSCCTVQGLTQHGNRVVQPP